MNKQRILEHRVMMLKAVALVVHFTINGEVRPNA